MYSYHNELRILDDLRSVGKNLVVLSTLLQWLVGPNLCCRQRYDNFCLCQPNSIRRQVRPST